ncbi:MAG: hypothetical protein J6K04_08000 [Lachnospiraceae bacterium]|nr:hypothetical protein [Lachnospiraceae bacterium]
MFGYVAVNKEELKIKEWNRYHAYYCGLCHSLKEVAGTKARMSVSYDMTFLTMLLDDLYDCSKEEGKRRCIVHPVGKHPFVKSEASLYAAKMNILLCYDNLLDDWRDDRNAAAAMAAAALRNCRMKIAQEYPRQTRAVEQYMEKLHACEEKRETNLDVAAGLTGEMLAELFCWKEDEWKKDLWGLGFYLGKFIYLMDAFEDMEKDNKRGNYNPFLLSRGKIKNEELAEQSLNMMAASAAENFERLPLVENLEILRNILYAGIWGKFEKVKAKREKEEKK